MYGAMLESEGEDRARVDQLYALEYAISILEQFVEGVPAQQVAGTVNDTKMAEAHFLYFKQRSWIELFRGQWYTTDDGKLVLSYLKMKHDNVNHA